MQDKIAGWLRHFHLVAIFVWVGLIYPSMAMWKSSVTWVVLMSVWANIMSHFSAYMGARAEKRAMDSEE